MRNITKNHSRVGILTDCPSTTPFGFALGPPNPWLITIAKETLDFRWEGLSPSLRLLRPTFSLLKAPPLFTRRLHCFENASLPRHLINQKASMSSVLNFSPGNLWRTSPLQPQKRLVWTVSCYTLFKR